MSVATTLIGRMAGARPRGRLMDLLTSRAGHDVLTVSSVLALLLGTAWSMFHGLGYWNLFDWDESRHIVSGYEMLRSGDYVINTYLGQPDYWNLKPPVSFWLIAGSIHLFGYTPFAVRLPSALATLVTIGVLIGFSFRRGGRIAAVVTAAAAASCVLLINYHSGRTADPDAVFIMFMVISVLCTLAAPASPGFLIGTTAACSFAFLTKSFHAGIALAFAALFILWVRKHSAVRRRHLLLALTGFLPVLVWAILRFQADGLRFLSGMVQYDLLARSASPLDGHSGPPLVYVQTILTTFSPWVLVAFGAGCLVVSRTAVPWRRILHPDRAIQPMLGAALWIAIVVLAFSTAATKLVWYVTDAVAVMCSLTGLLVAVAIRTLPNERRVQGSAALVVASLAALVLGLTAVHDAKSFDTPVPLQAAFGSVARSSSTVGADLFMDEALGTWMPSGTASAELGTGAKPSDGALAGFDAASGRRAIVVQDGSATDLAVRAKGAAVVGAAAGISVLVPTS